jgi:hypothetical protein
MACTIDRCAATATGSGTERVITVVVEGECPRTGYAVELKPTNEGVWDDPDVVALALAVEEGEVGDETITPFTARKEIHGDPAIRVRLDALGETEWIDVEKG